MRRNGSAIERLPVTDITFLLEEQTADPQTIALLAAFGSTDRRPSGEELVSTIGPRLPTAPVLRRRVHWPPWWQGRPLWVDDDRFDVTNHVRVAAVPAPGDEGSVLELAGELLAAPLDQTRPLWELWLLEGAADGRQWLLWKLHHAVARARKAGPRADAGFGALGSELMPVPLLRVVLGRALRGDQRFINSYVTDLIGPAERVSLAGAVIGEAFAIGPLSGGVGLGAAALSYGGQLAITLLADPDACPRADLVAAGMERFLSKLMP